MHIIDPLAKPNKPTLNFIPKPSSKFGAQGKDCTLCAFALNAIKKLLGK